MFKFSTLAHTIQITHMQIPEIVVVVMIQPEFGQGCQHVYFPWGRAGRLFFKKKKALAFGKG